MSVTAVLSSSDFALLCRVVDEVARAGRLPASDREDFSQWVHLHLLERNYTALGRFRGRSSLHTYVTVLVKHLLLDWRNLQFGKWRPSAWARRHGRVAIDLDRLVSRDRHSVDEAVAILSHRPGYPGVDVLRELALQVPTRQRPRLLPCEALESLATIDFADPVEAEENAAATRRRLHCLRRASQQLARLDRHLLHLRFEKNMPVVAIAAHLGLTAKPLYRRIDNAIASLRRSVPAFSAGLTQPPA